ncbi:serine/threonine-protein kinase [Streptomyces halobius]|uniref:non-specific serine/threonine protein kinase n=1 Tax=Streptomyces halobius TaxID=2879846 RepID=A0ABY4M527_9ACTN|nr:serine/threonine-protein kinase [Streptomyces halobius]UQA91486.1 serine/threonine protein kinase [Streptomyces halobius]
MRDQLLGGRYRLVRQIGEGGMGHVWEAQDETLGRPVAVKVISLLTGSGSRGDEARDRFLREARITAQLQHPNIVTIHDLGETGTADNRVPFLVMELVRGEGLDTKLRPRGAVTLPDAARWGAQICDALADAHEAGVMHRDIKPSNILITPSGAVKVLDFGVARAADPYATADRLTQTGFILGTPPYMAPEQARGFPEPRSDLYALGCLLYELITGRLPFQAPDTVGYLSAHLTQEPPAPSSVSTSVPSAWDDLVLTLLHKDPDKRYPNAASLSQALRQLDRIPTTAEPSRVPPHSDRQTTAVQPPPPGTLPLDGTQQPSGSNGPFTISWTGKEPLSAYANSRPVILVKCSTAALAVALVGFFITVPDELWSAVFGLIGVFALLSLLVVRFNKTAWSLQIGPPGIRTTHGPDRREYRWDQIQTFAIDDVVGKDTGGLYRCSAGLHVKFTKGNWRLAVDHTAGWPFLGAALVRNKMVPVCVLGPMTDQQRAALREALARYGHGKSDAEAWGE